MQRPALIPAVSVLDCGEGFPDLCLYLVAEFGVVLEQLLYCLASLGEPCVSVAEPGSALPDDVEFHSEVYDFPYVGNAFPEDYVEFCLFEWRRKLVLHYLDSCSVPESLLTVLYLGCLADVDTYGSIEFQSVAASGCFRVPEHYSDLVP